MTEQQNQNRKMDTPQPWSPAAKLCKRIAYTCALIFLVNLLVGKGSLIMGWKPPFLFDGVSEFLLLLFIVVMFIAALMIDEHNNKNSKFTQDTT